MTAYSNQEHFVAETSRLRLRELQPSDQAALAEILSDKEVMRFSIGGSYTTEQTQAFIEANRSLYRECGFGMWAMETIADGALIGFCGLSPTKLSGREEIELGYRLTPSAWGRGLATEAADAALTCGFEQCRLDSIIAIVAIDHSASASVALKTGMERKKRSQLHGWEVDIYRKYRRPPMS
ncbi:GNAT family N-acetyltransferase [Salinicola salarius]|jgi:RimJ/RimL family protein N-acetyltransferase|uniref:GNAT family N-acetyltransferase n=1 Tax=Salinicola salarius TaxID=430457 RepID=UPI000B3F9C55|nr:GNAT family N-acetyltransferase [Salinicola salarius]MDF3917842.1 GNAT family N-acetyltransferase [Salinicola salarius]